MTDGGLTVGPHGRRTGLGVVSGWLDRVAASPGFQRWAARFPLTRPLVRREGEAMFNLVAGFAQTQVLAAIIGLDLPAQLAGGPQPLPRLAAVSGLPCARLRVLVRAGAALGLLKLRRDGRVAMARRLVLLSSVPGLQEMIRHNRLLYEDLADPVGFFRGETAPQLAAFWPYVAEASNDPDPVAVARYSALMAASQPLVIDDTLAALDLAGVRVLMDVGGGTGNFAAAACRRNPGLRAIVFDLPGVAAAGTGTFDNSDLGARVRMVAGSFREDALPAGADAISLVRVLFDHSDATVAALLASVHAALPVGGRLIISEPMTGGHRPDVSGDAYFAIYTLAMGTGRARSAEEIGALCAAAGFRRVRAIPPLRPFVTSVLTAQRG